MAEIQGDARSRTRAGRRSLQVRQWKCRAVHWAGQNGDLRWMQLDSIEDFHFRNLGSEPAPLPGHGTFWLCNQRISRSKIGVAVKFFKNSAGRRAVDVSDVNGADAVGSGGRKVGGDPPWSPAVSPLLIRRLCPTAVRHWP